MSDLCQSMCIFKAGLSSSFDGQAKYKGKVPDVSDPNPNVETTCNYKLKLRIKDLFIKRVQEKLVKYELYVM